MATAVMANTVGRSAYLQMRTHQQEASSRMGCEWARHIRQFDYYFFVIVHLRRAQLRRYNASRLIILDFTGTIVSAQGDECDTTVSTAREAGAQILKQLAQQLLRHDDQVSQGAYAACSRRVC